MAREAGGVITSSITIAAATAIVQRAALAIIKGQVTEDVFFMLEQNNIYVVKVPANCTDCLQPMDLSVNKSVKEFMRNKFQEWYASEVQKQLDQGVEEYTPVDLRVSIMKPLGACWLVSVTSLCMSTILPLLNIHSQHS